MTTTRSRSNASAGPPATRNQRAARNVAAQPSGADDAVPLPEFEVDEPGSESVDSPLPLIAEGPTTCRYMKNVTMINPKLPYLKDDIVRRLRIHPAWQDARSKQPRDWVTTVVRQRKYNPTEHRQRELAQLDFVKRYVRLRALLLHR